MTENATYMKDVILDFTDLESKTLSLICPFSSELINGASPLDVCECECVCMCTWVQTHIQMCIHVDARPTSSHLEEPSTLIFR